MIPAITLLFALRQEANPIQSLCDKFNLKVEFRAEDFTDKAKGYQVTGTKVTDDGLKKYATLWVKEWSMYSADLFKKANVTRIVFAEKLAMNGQIRAAVPAFDLNTMYYDPVLGSHSDGFQRNVIHHEFFHMLEQRMKTLYRDKEWAALNPADFKYGSGGAKMRTPGVGNLTKDIPGFLTMYGTSAPEEDKAELYGHLIVDPDFVITQAKTDTILAAKIDLLKKRLAAYDPVFGENFWPKPKGDK